MIAIFQLFFYQYSTICKRIQCYTRRICKKKRAFALSSFSMFDSYLSKDTDPVRETVVLDNSRSLDYHSLSLLLGLYETRVSTCPILGYSNDNLRKICLNNNLRSVRHKLRLTQIQGQTSKISIGIDSFEVLRSHHLHRL